VILERVTHTPPRPPTNYALDVAARWAAIRTLYLAMRNREKSQ
jgi:hypothetical protein